jgi:hypothetical protein
VNEGKPLVVGRKRGGAGSPSGPGGGDDGSWKSKLWRIMVGPSRLTPACPCVDRARFQRLRLNSDEPVSSLDFNFNLRRYIMDDPSSGPAGAAVAVTILLLILYSTATFCMETLHPFYKPTLKTTDFWYISEAVCIGIFTLEAALRLLSCPNRREYLSSVMNIVDLVAISPFYLELLITLLASSGGVEVPGRGLHSSTFRRRFLWNRGCILGLFRGSSAGKRGYKGGIRVHFVSERAQVELKSGRVSAPDARAGRVPRGAPGARVSAAEGVGQLHRHVHADHGRGFHSFTFRLNVSAFCGIGGALRVVSG